MVRLAHELGDGDSYFEVFYGKQGAEPSPAHEPPAVQRRRRAA
jgi:hypothetical protein